MTETYMQEITEIATTVADTDIALITTNISTVPVSKIISWSNIKATLKTYFDGLYMSLVAPSTSGNVLTSNGSAWVSSSKSTLAKYPDGSMWNGRITPSVGSNNLTVALKTLAGTDASSTDPIYITINGAVRTITSALSITKNAGTNWFNAGGLELATKEIDYFVYLGYNATDGVVLGYSRIPYATLYSDFSATTTNEKYCAISTITNAAAGDNYVNIGRFAATLSAGAGYTWSVPTFTTINLVQRPIFETRLLGWSPTITSDTGAPTTVTNVCSYKIINRDIEYLVAVTIVDKGTANGNINLTYPFLVATTQSAGGRENGATGIAVCAKITSTIIGLSLYNGTTLWVNTYNPSVLIRTIL